VAAGSANEVVAALHVAVAWGHIKKEDTKDALGLLDRELAMLYKLGRLAKCSGALRRTPTERGATTCRRCAAPPA